MLGIAAAAQFMSAPGQSYSVAAFKDPMREGLGISETNFSLAYGFATVLSALLLPWVGRLVDRHGARVMLPLVATGLGAACLLMSRVDSLFGLYVGFSCVRGLGQGALTLISMWIVGEWFARRRGVATAIAGIAGSLSVMSVPLLNNWCIAHYDWPMTWVALGLAVWALLVLPCIVLLRNRPEDLGLHPDGVNPLPLNPLTIDSDESATHSPTTTAAAAVEPPRFNRLGRIAPTDEAWTVAEVVRDATFWKLLSVPATAALVGTGLIFHQVALLGSHGLSPTSALGLLTVQAGCATAVMFPVGWLTDRVPSRFLLSISMIALALANVLAMTMPAMWLAVVYALLLGLHGSIMRSTATVVWINFYGRANQGAVRGVAWSIMIFAAAIGPLPLAASIDRFGSYTPALYVFLALPLLSTLAVWTAHPPRRPQCKPSAG
jgi:sugar phosphate permease